MRSKLIRNLKPGDRFTIVDYSTARIRTQTVTVRAVQETRSGHFTGKRRWEVIADYPWWWTIPVTGYSNDRVDLVD